jgi:tetratricopeptide (TPR) repeat protein
LDWKAGESLRPHVRAAILAGTVALLVVSCSSDPQKSKVKYFASGEKYMKEQKYAEAALEFRNAIRIDPRFVDAYYGLSQAAEAQHDWLVVENSLDKVIELAPERGDARLDRGRLYLAGRQFAKAQADANWLLSKNPNNPDANQVLGTAYLGQQKPEEALKAFSRLAELRPGDANTYLNLAVVNGSLQRKKDVEENLKKAVTIDPKSAKIRIGLAQFYQLQNKLPQAQETLQEGVQNNPTAPELYMALAYLLAAEGKRSEADAVLEKLRAELPKSAEAAVAIGDFYIRTNTTDKALGEYRRAISESPNNIDILKRAQEAYLSANQISEAAKLDSQLIHLAPTDPLVKVLHSRVLLAQGKEQEAINTLQNVLNDAPALVIGHYYLALAYWQNQQLGEANRELLEALKMSPGAALVLNSLVQLNLAKNNFPGALAYAMELVQRNPNDVDGRLELAGIYLHVGNLSLAEEQLAAANRIAPSDAKVHMNLGILRARQKQWEQADKEFETANRLAPGELMILSAYADYLVSRGQREKAVRLVQQFVQANLDNAQAHVKLATLKLNSKDMSAAQKELERAIQIDPKNVLAHVRLGGIYEAQNEAEAAIAQYKAALALQPKSASLMTLMGNLYLKRNDFDTARKYYVQALDADPDFPVANANLAWIDAENGKDLDRALSMARKAQSVMPDEPAISDVLAWVMYQQGNYAWAIPLLQECVKKQPESAQYRYHLGLALLAAGQKQDGRSQLEAALEKNKLRPAEQEQARRALVAN